MPEMQNMMSPEMWLNKIHEPLFPVRANEFNAESERIKAIWQPFVHGTTCLGGLQTKDATRDTAASIYSSLNPIKIPLRKDDSLATTASNTSRSGEFGSRPSSPESNHFVANHDSTHWMPEALSEYPYRIPPSVFWQDATASAKEEVRHSRNWMLDPVASHHRSSTTLWQNVTSTGKIDLQSSCHLMHDVGSTPVAVTDALPTQAQMPKTHQKKLNGRLSGNRKKTDLTVLNPPPSNYSGITTLMIRGIPCSFLQEDLLNLVASAGLEDFIDFFYLPRAGNSASNLGYAFINFTETIHAWTCAFAFNGVRFDPARSTKVCTVSPADIQGIPNLRRHFRRTAVSRGLNGPLFLGDKKSNKLKSLMQRAGKSKDEAC